MEQELPRMDHQNRTFDKLLKNDVFLDFSDPGTGKTRSQVDIVSHLRARGAKSALVVAPKTLLYSTWVREIDRWQPHLTSVVAPAGKRKTAFEKEDIDFYITNTDAAVWLLEQDPKFFDKFDILIVDEISKFKNPQAKRTKAMMALSRYFKYRYALTGTPIPNTVFDIWSQVFIIDLGEHLGDNFYHFRSTTCEPKQVGQSPHAIQWNVKPGMLETVGQLLGEISIRHDFSLLNIPPNTLNIQAYKMNKTHRALYDKLKRTAIVRVGEEYIVGVNAATLLGKLLQLCAGTAYSELGDMLEVDTQRTDLVVELIEARQHSVVFFNYKHQRNALMKALKKKKITHCVLDGETRDKMRDRYIERFQRGMYQVMLAQPAAAAHGITLTKATSTIWYGLTWNLEHWLQGNRRIHRKGQEKATETLVVMAENTVEQNVLDKLSAKDASQNTVLNVLKELS